MVHPGSRNEQNTWSGCERNTALYRCHLYVYPRSCADPRRLSCAARCVLMSSACMVQNLLDVSAPHPACIHGRCGFIGMVNLYASNRLTAWKRTASLLSCMQHCAPHAIRCSSGLFRYYQITLISSAIHRHVSGACLLDNSQAVSV